MRTLDQFFWRKGIFYETMERTQNTAMFKLSVQHTPADPKEHVGFEVCRVYLNPARVIHNIEMGESESLSSDELFGYDGSKAFFKHDEARAKDYFFTLDSEILESLRMKAEKARI